MKYFIGDISINDKSTKYFIIASKFLLEEEIKEYLRDVYLLYLDDNLDLSSLDIENGEIVLDIETNLKKSSEKEFNYWKEDSQYYLDLHFKVLLFGNQNDELISIYKIEQRDEIKILETYWVFELSGSIENDNISVIDCVNVEQSLDQATEKARQELAYQIRRYYPEIYGAASYSSLLCITQITAEEYDYEMEKIKECKIL